MLIGSLVGIEIGIGREFGRGGVLFGRLVGLGSAWSVLRVLRGGCGGGCGGGIGFLLGLFGGLRGGGLGWDCG